VSLELPVCAVVVVAASVAVFTITVTTTNYFIFRVILCLAVSTKSIGITREAFLQTKYVSHC